MTDTSVDTVSNIPQIPLLSYTPDTTSVTPGQLQDDTTVPGAQTLPTIGSLVKSVFGPLTGDTSTADEGAKKDETYMQQMHDQFAKAVDTVQTTAALVGGVLKGAAATVAGAGAEGVGAINQDKTGIQAQSAADQTKATIEGAARDKEQNDDLTVATAENLTPAQMVDRANHMTELANSVSADNAELRKRASVSIFDDPLTFVGNLFTTPFVKRKHDADLESFKEEAGILQTQQTQLQDSYKVNAGLDAAHGANYTKAVTDSIAAKATQAQAAATLEDAKFKSSNAQVTASLTDAEMNTAVKDASVRNSAATEARETVAFNLEKPARAQMIQQRAEDLKKADEENNIATAALGIPGLNNTNIKQLKGAAGTAFEIAKNSIYQDVAAGVQPSDAALGPTPLTAVFVKDKLGIRMNNAAAEDTANWIKSTQAEMSGMHISDPSRPGIATAFRSLKPDEQNELVDERIRQKMDNYYSSIPATGSPYSPGPLSSIVKIPMVANTTIGKALAPMGVASPLAPIDWNVLFATAQKLIDDGKLTNAQAAIELNTIGKQMTAQVNQVRGLNRLALTPLGTEQRPSFNITTKDTVGNVQSVDLNNISSIENFLTRSQASRKSLEFSNRSFGIGQAGTPSDIFPSANQ